MAPKPRRAVAPDPALALYAAKRNFARTPEPHATAAPQAIPAHPQALPASAPAPALSFVIQKHWATRLHYDFRLELNGVLLSWAVPKGPCLDPQEKRVAIHVEDHPVAYGGFEGIIPPKQYGAGTVIVWDRGTWQPVGDANAGLAQGKLLFTLHGEKLAGAWELVRIAKPGDKQDPWILFKKRDAWARPLAEYDVISALPDSVIDQPLGPIEARKPGPTQGALAATTAPPALADVPGAAQAEMPEAVAPQLATLATQVPTHGTWSCEVKFDGYRLLARIEHGRARLLTRNGNDWTDKLMLLAQALGQLPLQSAWLDGEIVVLNTAGVPDFNALQNAFDSVRTGSITYFAFDLVYLDGFDLRAAPLQARRALLEPLIGAAHDERLRFSAAFAADPASVLESARALGLEGIVAKRSDAPYSSSRNSTWLKLKCHAQQEFVIGGYILRDGSSTEVGSLMLGVHDAKGALAYVGNVGTGWSAATASTLRSLLAPLETNASPFAGPIEASRWSRRAAGVPRWVTPALIAQVQFRDWTQGGHVRHASFRSLRDDKAVRDVVREGATPPAAPVARHGAGVTASANRVGAIQVSHAERIIDASSNLTKLDLVRYYESVAPWMLRHLQGRPVTLVRGPSGVAGELFFQKFSEASHIPALREFDPTLWPGHPPLLEVPSAEALISAAQMNVIEFHTWNSLGSKIDKPDRIVFDLDPGEGVAWTRVQEAATLTRAMLVELGLQSWLKTSGGKGLHVVVPITPRLGYDDVKAFSQAVVQHLAKTIPSRFVAKSGPANRVGRVYVDYLRNSHGATTAAAFSARARPGLGVSMPIAWEQLAALKSGAQWSVATAREYLSFQREDPWAAYWTTRQTLTAGKKVLAAGQVR